MSLCALNDDGQPAAKRGGSIAARGGKRQREVAGAEYCHRAERRAVLSRIGARQGERRGSAQSMRYALDIAAPAAAWRTAASTAGSGAFAIKRAGGRAVSRGEGEEVSSRHQLLGDGVQKFARCSALSCE